MNYLTHIPFGHSIPFNNPHAVSVSLPLISQVIKYEEGDIETRSLMRSGYPRFRMNNLLELVCRNVRLLEELPENKILLPLSSVKAVRLLEQTFKKKMEIISSGDIVLLVLDTSDPKFQDIKYFIQHSGLIPSSRRAEDYLLRNQLLRNEFPEVKANPDSAEQTIKRILSEAYGNTFPDHIFLCSSGMNAVYSIYYALKAGQEKKNKKTFIQLGWLYLDTMEIIKKYSHNYYHHLNLNDLDSLENYIKEKNGDVAGVFTEVPNNPLIQSVDLQRLRKLSIQYDFAIIADTSIGTPFNVEVMEYVDIAVESLTKFASGNGDILMGAVILNAHSQYALSLRDVIADVAEKPYIKDISRLAYEIVNYEKRVRMISENTIELVNYLKTQKQVDLIHWAKSCNSEVNYNKIRKNELAVPGVISVVFKKELYHYYDKLRLPKGPSLGTEFTLAMPYIYMAHYDLLRTRAGRMLLENIGVIPELLRISVGTEPIEELIKVFEEVF
ncbi:MAG: PLP-dependent transferase [Ignavibacteria bacterium]